MPPPAEGFTARLVLGPTLRTQPDRRLVTLVREGYESAFEEIVRRYGKPLTRYAAAIVGSHGEDVTQDAFSKALLALRRNDAEIELRPWLFRIVRNTALNDLRDSPPTPELLAEAIAGGQSPAEELERREELTDLMHRLQSLPEPQRAAIVMREMEGLSHEEIAAALGVSGGAARQAIHRARQTLRNGAGMLVPLPLLKALLAAGPMGSAEVAAGASGTVGAGVALKAVTATVLVAGAVGAGVAVHDGRHSSHNQVPASASASRREAATPSTTAAPVAAIVDDRSGSSGGDHRGRSEREPGDDHGGKGQESGEHHGGRQEEPGDDHGGHGEEAGDDQASSGPGSGDDHGGRGSGSGGGDDGGGSGSSSGGSGGHGSSHGGSSGHGGGSGTSNGSGHGGGSLDDDLAAAGETGSSGGPGPSAEQQPAPEESSGSGGGPGPSGGSGSGEGSESGGSGDGSGGGDQIDD
jgi:RNA polymerase sigma factor (sigma-70 family)